MIQNSALIQGAILGSHLKICQKSNHSIARIPAYPINGKITLVRGSRLFEKYDSRER